MDFEKLFDFLPKTTEKWSIDDVAMWLNFIGLGNCSEKFSKFSNFFYFCLNFLFMFIFFRRNSY